MKGGVGHSPHPPSVFSTTSREGKLKMKRFLICACAVALAVAGYARDLEDIVKPLEQQRLLYEARSAPNLGELWMKHAIGSAIVTGCVDTVYTGSAIQPSIGVFLDGGKTNLTASTDYTTTYAAATNVGRYAVTITANKVGYYGSLTTYFNILPKTLATNAVTSVSAQSYTGSEVKPTATVKDGNTTLTLNTDYTVDYRNNIEKGSNALMRVTGKGNYTGAVDTFFVIE